MLNWNWRVRSLKSHTATCNSAQSSPAVVQWEISVLVIFNRLWYHKEQQDDYCCWLYIMYLTNNMVTFCTVVTVYMLRWDRYYLLMNKLKTPVSLECVYWGILLYIYMYVTNQYFSHITCVMFSVRGASWECFWLSWVRNVSQQCVTHHLVATAAVAHLLWDYFRTLRSLKGLFITQPYLHFDSVWCFTHSDHLIKKISSRQIIKKVSKFVTVLSKGFCLISFTLS